MAPSLYRRLWYSSWTYPPRSRWWPANNDLIAALNFKTKGFRDRYMAAMHAAIYEWKAAIGAIDMMAAWSQRLQPAWCSAPRCHVRETAYLQRLIVLLLLQYRWSWLAFVQFRCVINTTHCNVIIHFWFWRLYHEHFWQLLLFGETNSNGAWLIQKLRRERKVFDKECDNIVWMRGSERLYIIWYLHKMFVEKGWAGNGSAIIPV